ncbi:MAG: hypothetical protein PHV52_00060 [Aliarcobacter sp.]|nr:hypothetical protein [Aliarcobacter sp.]
MSKPILFNTEMVKAILDERKTQTRRVFSKTQLKYFDYAQKLGEMNSLENLHENDFSYILQFSKYKIDDILYVREPVKVMSPPIETCRKMALKYLADNLYADIVLDKEFDISKKWIQRCQGVPNGCIKEMARIFLKVIKVRVERLQDITLADMICEGINHIQEYSTGKVVKPFTQIKREFIKLWNSTAKDGYKYEDNPPIFVYEFERIIGSDKIYI